MIPGLPSGNRSKIYRRIVEQLQTDPVLSNVVKVWDTWDGDPDNPALTIAEDLVVQLTPQLGPVDWYSPDAQAGTLDIEISVGAHSFYADDWLDFWDAFERALYPYNDNGKQLTFQQALRDLGAETGQVRFSNPASVQPALSQSGQLVCVGMMRINVIRAFNP